MKVEYEGLESQEVEETVAGQICSATTWPSIASI